MSRKSKQYEIIDIMVGGTTSANAAQNTTTSATTDPTATTNATTDPTATTNTTTTQSTTTSATATQSTNQASVETFVGPVSRVSVEINFQKFTFDLSEFKEPNILLQNNLNIIDASANDYLSQIDKYKTDYTELKNKSVQALIAYTKKYDEYEDNLKNVLEYQELKKKQMYEQRNFNNLDLRLKSIEKKEKEIDNLPISEAEKNAKKQALSDARHTSDLNKDQLSKMREASQKELDNIDKLIKEVETKYMTAGLAEPNPPTPAGSELTLYDLSKGSINALEAFKKVSVNGELETNITNLEKTVINDLEKISTYYKQIDTSYNLAKWNAGTADIYRDESADSSLENLKTFRNQILKITKTYEDKVELCKGVSKKFRIVNSGLEAQSFLDEKKNLKTTVKTIFGKMNQHISTMSVENIDYTRLNADLIKMITESVDDIGLYDPYVKEIFSFLKALSLIGNDIDKITTDITSQERYRNVFDEKLIISIKNIQKQIAILDINVIRVKLNELRKFKNSLYDLKRIDVFYARMSELQVELDELKAKGTQSKEKMEAMEEELTDLRKIKKTLNYAMSDLVDQYTNNLKKVNEILTNQGIESEQNMQIEQKKLEKLQIEQIETIVTSITEDMIGKEIENVEKTLKESIDLDDTKEINDDLANFAKSGIKTESLYGGSSGVAITDDVKKAFVSYVGIRMGIFNRKEFHLFFTIMSEEEYFNLLCEKVFANKKDLLMRFLDVIFVDLSLKDDTNNKNLADIGGTEAKRDSVYYKYYYDAITKNQNLQWVQTDPNNQPKEIKEPLFLNTYVEKLKQGTNYLTYFNASQILKYKIVEKIFEFISKPTVFKHLKIIYNMLIKKICPIYTFIKIRQDTSIPNPRYDVKPRLDIKESYTEEGSNDPDDIALTITYYNSDKSLPFVDPQIDKAGAKEGKFVSTAPSTTLVDFRSGATVENYYIGPVTGFFSASSNNATIAKDITVDKNITDKIINGNDVIIIGNGQSGSGKTSTLVYLRDNVNNNNVDGIIPIMCNGEKFHENFEKLEVSAVEIYVKWDENIKAYTEINSSQYFVQNLRLTDQDVKDKVTSYTFVKETFQKENTWIYTDKQSTKSKLSDIIDRLLNRRLIGPTKNNPDSSRSHVLILIKFFKPGQTTPHSKMVICDLAGVEDRFKCGLNDIITSFDKLSVGNTFYKNTGSIQVDNSVAKCDPKSLKNQNDTPFEKKQSGGFNRKEFKEFNEYTERKDGFNPKTYYEKITKNKYDTSFNFSFDIRDTNKDDQKKTFENYIVLKQIMEKYASEYPYPYQDSQSFIDKFFTPDTAGQKLDDWAEFLFGIADKNQIKALSQNDKLKNLIEYMLYNCMVRRYEGYIINKTLREMRNLITNLTFNIIKNQLAGKMNPLFFLIPSVYNDKIYCYGDNYQFDKNYNYFYGSNEFKPDFASNKTGGSIIFDIMFGTDRIETKNILDCNGSDPVIRFNLNVSKVSISLVTLINLTAGLRVNNPPNPPYINVNKLKQIINILKYFREIRENRKTFFSDNYDSIFEPVLDKIRNYLIGKYSKVEDVVDLDVPPDNINDDVADLYAILAGRDDMVKDFLTKQSDEKGRLKMNHNTVIGFLTGGVGPNIFSSLNQDFIKNVQNNKRPYSIDELLVPNAKMDYYRFKENEPLGKGWLVVRKKGSDLPYKINGKIVYRQTEFNKQNLSHFRKIASSYSFYKNTFAANELLKILYVSKLKAIGEWGKFSSSEHEKILGTIEKCIQLENKDLDFSDAIYAKTIPDKDEKNNTIDKSKLHIIDFYYWLAKYIYDVIDSSNPATLIGTVDFQEYTQFRDTEKLYMTCDGNNNSYQIIPGANKDFENQPLPQQQIGGFSNPFEWIDINI